MAPRPPGAAGRHGRRGCRAARRVRGPERLRRPARRVRRVRRPGPSGTGRSPAARRPAAVRRHPPHQEAPELPRGGRTSSRATGSWGSAACPARRRSADSASAIRTTGRPRSRRRPAATPTAASRCPYWNSSRPWPPPPRTAAPTAPDPGHTIDRFHPVARAHRSMLLLNIQPGRARVLDEVRALRDWLVRPDVGIALDPEWEMGSGEVPGDTYGHTSGQELTAVARYLSALVADHDLPEKPLVFHQVAPSVLQDQRALRPHDGVVLVKSADGIGSPGLKRATWHRLVQDLPGPAHRLQALLRGGHPRQPPDDAEGGPRSAAEAGVRDVRVRPGTQATALPAYQEGAVRGPRSS
ncbi:hypothetical protein NKH77_00995 [Streptomyces sp. M19]